jgi:glutamate synthase domain-containing protein 1
MDAREKGWDDGVFGEDLAKIVPVLDPSGSDSGIFDTAWNCSRTRAVPAPRHDDDDPGALAEAPGHARGQAAFYEYHAS